jgi:hypothetical protein
MKANKKNENEGNEERKEQGGCTPLQLATYLVSSARDCLDEPPIYGPLRLLVGVSKLIELSRSVPQLKDEFLERMERRINEDVLKVMSDREAFQKALDDLLLEFSKELKKRELIDVWNE